MKRARRKEAKIRRRAKPDREIDRNRIAVRVALREGGAAEDGIGQVKDVLARYWDELTSLGRDVMFGVIAAEVRSAEARYKRKNLA